MRSASGSNGACINTHLIDCCNSPVQGHTIAPLDQFARVHNSTWISDSSPWILDRRSSIRVFVERSRVDAKDVMLMKVAALVLGLYSTCTSPSSRIARIANGSMSLIFEPSRPDFAPRKKKVTQCPAALRASKRQADCSVLSTPHRAVRRSTDH